MKASVLKLTRKPLTALTLKDLDCLVDPEQNVKLYAAIRERMLSFLGTTGKEPKDLGKIAFAEPFYKPTNDGRRGPIVKSVKLSESKQSGITVRSGIASNGEMLFVDVFERKGKFYFAPAYVDNAMRGELPYRVITSHKPEEQWPVIDNTFNFLFRLYKYDLIKVIKRDRELFWLLH